MIQTLFAFVLVAGFFAIEVLLRQGTPAKSLKTTDSDKGSTLLVGASIGAAIILPPLLNLLQVGQIALPIVSWLGLVIMLLGLGLRVWSMRVLGAYYSRTLRVADTQVIVTQGPYRVVRHPGYLGTILLWVGYGLALANGIATVGWRCSCSAYTVIAFVQRKPCCSPPLANAISSTASIPGSCCRSCIESQSLQHGFCPECG